jgi:hypothetical protein
MVVKIKAKKEIEFNAKTLKVSAGVRYWEDAEIDGVEDTKGTLTPCRVDDYWCPEIDIDTGVITNWQQGKTADIHFKICDDGKYEVVDDAGVVQLSINGYVPGTMSPKDSGDGDYIIMDVDANGKIDKWNFDVSDFFPEDDE